MEAMKPEQPVDEVIPPVRLTYGAHRVSFCFFPSWNTGGLGGPQNVMQSIPFPRGLAVQQRLLPWCMPLPTGHCQCRLGWGIPVGSVRRRQYHL